MIKRILPNTQCLTVWVCLSSKGCISISYPNFSFLGSKKIIISLSSSILSLSIVIMNKKYSNHDLKRLHYPSHISSSFEIGTLQRDLTSIAPFYYSGAFLCCCAPRQSGQKPGPGQVNSHFLTHFYQKQKKSWNSWKLRMTTEELSRQ